VGKTSFYRGEIERGSISVPSRGGQGASSRKKKETRKTITVDIAKRGVSPFLTDGRSLRGRTLRSRL